MNVHCQKVEFKRDRSWRIGVGGNWDVPRSHGTGGFSGQLEAVPLPTRLILGTLTQWSRILEFS